MAFFLLSCGKTINGEKKQQTQQDEMQSPKEIDGVYRADLYPLNPVIDGNLSGAATVARERDELVVDVYVANGRPHVFHPQNIHRGKRCPTEKDDSNQDGFIDADEAFRVVGEIITPIDDDISTQWMGLGTYPITDEFGSYYWAKATSFKKLLQDLYENDINLDDDLMKLPQGNPLSLEGNVVLILGAHPDEEIPYTVSGRKHLSRHQSLPVACGVLKKIDSSPGKIDQDEPIQI